MFPLAMGCRVEISATAEMRQAAFLVPSSPRKREPDVFSQTLLVPRSVTKMSGDDDCLSNLGAEAMPMTPAEFKSFVRGEIEDSGKVIKAAGIKAQRRAPATDRSFRHCDSSLLHHFASSSFPICLRWTSWVPSASRKVRA